MPFLSDFGDRWGVGAEMRPGKCGRYCSVMVAATPNPNLIAFVGDLHGKMAAFEYTTAQALNRGVTTIVQVGDFWIYDRAQELIKPERVLRRICPDGIAVEDINYMFIDGNHENFDVLTPDATSPVAMSGTITYMPRGLRQTAAGVELLFFGGASSVDKDWRTPLIDWWPQENITEGQFRRVTEKPVDVLVTHETTTAAFDALCAVDEHPRDKIDDSAGAANRRYLDQVVAVTQPRVQVHGHHHTHHISRHDGVTDIALSLERTLGSVTILDTSDWTWTVPVGRRDSGEDERLGNLG